MSSLGDDTNLTFNLVTLLNKELNTVKARLAELEVGSSKITPDADVHTTDALTLSDENSRLRAEIAILESRVLRMPDRHDNDETTADTNLPDDERVRRLVLEAAYKRVEAERNDLELTCKSLRDKQIQFDEMVNKMVQSEGNASVTMPSDLPLATMSTDPTTSTLNDMGYRAFMQGLPSVLDMPDLVSLKACFKSIANEKHLQERLQQIGCHTAVIYLPNQLVWGLPDDPGCMHPCLIAPAFEYDARAKHRGKFWNEHVQLAPLVGQTREVFQNRDHHTWYCGTYKCIQAPQLSRDEYQALLPHIKSKILQLAIKSREAASPPIIEMIIEMYTKGIARVNCIGLQCIGFNRELYDQIQSTRGPPPGKKRKQVPPSNNPQTKRPRIQ